jgi:hypothetical protein
MSNLVALSVSMVLLLTAFPLISYGTTQGPPWLWQMGLAALVAGGAIPPVGRFLAAPRPDPPAAKTGMSEDCRVS